MDTVRRRICWILAGLCASSGPSLAEDRAVSGPSGPVVAASRRRSDAAQERLRLCREKAAELTNQHHELDVRIAAAAARMRVAQDPAHVAAEGRVRALQADIEQLEDQLGRLKPEVLRNLDELMDHDRLTDELARHRAALPRERERLTATIHGLVRREPDGNQLCDRWDALVAPLVAAQNEVALAQTARDQIVRAEGNLQNSLKPRPEPGGSNDPVIRLAVPPPADADLRRTVFAGRASPEAIVALGERFFSQMTLDGPGLEAVKTLVEREEFGPALEAYKEFFFHRLRSPHAPDASTGELVPETEDSAGETTAAGAVMSPPTQAAIAEALAGRVSGSFPVKGKTVRVEAPLGQPGAMHWAFATPELLGDDPHAPLILQLCREQNHPGMTGIALLSSYALGGPPEHFDRWVEILDDWTLNWQRDAERSPVALRDYHLLYVHRIQETLARFRDLALMRPEAIDRLPAATLARWLMAMNEEYLSSAVRLGRSGLYNFRIMALNGMIPTSASLPEFHAHQWAVREGWRQVDDNFIYKIRRDGANFEFANDGHENTDQSLMLPFRVIRALDPPPDWLEPFWDAEFTDNIRSNARYWIHNLKQDGFSYRLNHRTQRMRYLGSHPEYKVDLLADEPEVRRRLWAVMHVGQPEPPPRVHSEGMAYQGYYYLRSGWDPDDSFLYFQSIGQPILSGREDDTGFSIYGKGTILLLAPAPAVDGRTQNIHHGLVQNPGGKAPFATYGRPDVVQEGRFLANDRFDLVEGTFSGVYQYHRPDTFFDSFGSYGYEASLKKAEARAAKAGVEFVDEPIRDVRQSRRVLSVRGREIYIVTDVLDSEEPHQFTQNYTVYTPLRLDHLPQRVALLEQAQVPLLRVDRERQTLATCNLGLPNLSLRHIGGIPVSYSLPEDRQFATLVKDHGDASGVLKGFGKRDKHHTEASGWLQLHRQVGVNWNAKGRHVLVTLVLPQGRCYEPAGPPETLRDVVPTTPSQDVAGFTARCADGTRIAYVAGATPMDLRVPDVSATASTLLLCGEDGIALDCTRIASGGKSLVPPARDFTFRVVNGEITFADEIHRPIEPVAIEPAVNVFTDSTTVSFSCATPNVELRYTLDGSRPTPQSPLYARPFPISETCRVKVRAFRKGVTEDVWQQDGTHASVVYSAVFRKESPIPAAREPAGAPGLRFEYFEGIWTELMVRGLTMPARHSGVVSTVLDVSPRKTDGAFGIRYEGLIDVPEDGVYTFHAPREFIDPDIESGYDLRVFVAGREWYPAVRWHGHGTWSLPLQKGRHPLRVVFVDLRPRPHKIELMWGFPHPDFTWKGDAPTLEISGPGLARQPIPATMLRHQEAAESNE